MRGFPLLNTLLVVAIFGLAWWPLHQLTGSRSATPPPPQALASPELTALSLRFFAASPLTRLRVELLGKPVLDLSPNPGESDFEHLLDPIEIPSEGIEFWVEAEFATPADQANYRPALGIEASPDGTDLAPLQITLWGEPGTGRLADLAVFVWNPHPTSP